MHWLRPSQLTATPWQQQEQLLLRVSQRLLPVLRAEGLPASSSEPGPKCGTPGSGVLGKGQAGPAQASLGGLSPTAMPGEPLLVGSGECRAERPQAKFLPSGLCPQPQPR